MNWWQSFGHRHSPSSVIVDDRDILGVPRFVIPDEEDAPLLINADTMLAGPLTLQGLQAISRWHPQVFEPRGSVQHFQFALGDPRTVRSDLARYATFEQSLRLLGLERGNHNAIPVYTALGITSSVIDER